MFPLPRTTSGNEDVTLPPLRGLQTEETDTVKFDRLLQICFSAAFLMMFFIMLCLTLFGRRLRPLPNHDGTYDRDPHSRHVTNEERKKYIERALVIKHVIPKPKAESSNGGSITTTPSTGSQCTLDEEQPFSEKKESCVQSQVSTKSSTEPRFQRLKSNLIISDPDDLESARGSSREPWICAICLTPYDIGDEICWSQNPDCNHVFHHECIEHWLYKHEDCPMCRAAFIALEDEQRPWASSARPVATSSSSTTTTTATTIPEGEVFDLENSTLRDEDVAPISASTNGSADEGRIVEDDESSVITFGSRSAS